VQGVDWNERLHAAIDFLEASLEEDIEMEEAAALANCSLFHFMRMFEVVCGVTPGEYVRRRRLSRAALDLAASDARVIDVAVRYRYDTPESFAKAFKRLFGLTPRDARAPGASLSLYTRLHISVVLHGGSVMHYRIVEKPAFKAAGPVIETSGVEGANLKEIPAFWRTRNADGTVGRLAGHMGPLGLLGVCYDYNPRDSSLKYMIGIEAPPHGLADLPAGAQLVPIPGGTYAVFESVGPMPGAIQQTWKRIYSEWFPASGYEHAGAPELEVYPPNTGSKGDITSPDYVCEVWIPVRRRQT
jgi:AraC family transcriptional regulator